MVAPLEPTPPRERGNQHNPQADRRSKRWSHTHVLHPISQMGSSGPAVSSHPVHMVGEEHVGILTASGRAAQPADVSG